MISHCLQISLPMNFPDAGTGVNRGKLSLSPIKEAKLAFKASFFVLIGVKMHVGNNIY